MISYAILLDLYRDASIRVGVLAGATNQGVITLGATAMEGGPSVQTTVLTLLSLGLTPLVAAAGAWGAKRYFGAIESSREAVETSKESLRVAMQENRNLQQRLDESNQKISRTKDKDYQEAMDKIAELEVLVREQQKAAASGTEPGD